MSWVKRLKTVSSVFYSIAVLSLVLAGLWFGASINSTEARINSSGTDSGAGTTFPGTNTGAIPDRGSTGCGPPFGPARDVMFNVTGLSGTVTDVNVDMTATHSWVGDVQAELIAPNATSHIIFSRTGATTATSCGDTSDLAGMYIFDDSASQNWWQVAGGTTAAVPPGSYRTTAAGPQATANNSPATSLNTAFNGVSPNGTWILRLTDGGGGDTGSVSAANLTIASGGVTAPPQHVVDFDGNGRTDFAVVRNTGGGASGQVTWFISLNGPGTTNGYAWGIASDFFVPEDYDGDNKTDIAIWRPISTGQPSGNAFFYILRSATNTVRIDDFGQSGDDPTVVGDYDGDGSADPAVYRAGATAGAPSFWYWRGSLTPGNVSARQWGQNGDFPAPGDYDGDGKNDFVIQRNAGGGQGAFWMNQTTAGLATVIFGTPTDVIVPGDYDGDGKTDIAIVRGSAGSIQWWYRKSSDSGIVGNTWGLSATDFPVQGDYDGDGKTDLAIWRASATPGASAFWYFGSTSGATGVGFGATGDYPVANYNSH